MKNVQVGDEVRVSECINGHEFELDSLVEVKKINEKRGAYLCTNGEEEWWLEDDEFTVDSK